MLPRSTTNIRRPARAWPCRRRLGSDRPCNGACVPSGLRLGPAAERRARRRLEALARTPGPLGLLYRRPGQLLEGGPAAFRRQLTRLKGRPVVVNKWASWCGPCRYEFPFFQKQVAKRGRRVAFLAVDGEDTRDSAQRFLRKFPGSVSELFRSAQQDRGGLPGRPGVPDDRVLRQQGGARLHEAGRLRLGGCARKGHCAMGALNRRAIAG